MLPLHPAVPISAHLWPGIKSWASEAIEYIAHLNIDKLRNTDVSRKAFESWYIHSDPLHSALTFSTILASFVFVVGRATDNASTVDRLWTFLPVIFSAHFALHSHWTSAANVSKLFSWSGAYSKWQSFIPNGVDERMFLILVLQVIWSIRLSYNTLRRGFFDFSKEDYRWPIVRAKLTKFQFAMLDLIFVAFTQVYLLMATALPQYFLLTATRAYHPANPTTPLGWPDFAIAALFLLNLVFEQIADSQQQAFQMWKHGSAKKEGKDTTGKVKQLPRGTGLTEGNLQRGFLTSGLWAWSRHPNFLCEQLNFWILPLFTVRATVPQAIFDQLYSSAKTSIDLRQPAYFIDNFKIAIPHFFNYSWIISLAMSGLFLASTLLTEYISSDKYPKYRTYQQRVGMFLPGTTILKGLWLGLRGTLGRVNEEVYGASKSKEQ